MADSLNVTPELNPESQEYIDAMAAKGEAAVNGGVAPEATTTDIEPKPEGVPDKFYDPATGKVDYQGLAKSYVELEKAQSTAKEKPVEKTEETPKEAPKSEDAADKAVADAGLDMATLQKEYAESGVLSDESYAKLEKSGIPKDMVNDYIEGQVARVEIMKSQAYALTDGAEGYQAMVEYAKANLTPKEIAAYNAAVNSRDGETRSLAIQGMWAKYNADSGNGGNNLITGKTNTKVSPGTYASRAEMMADMGDPRYKSDPAFRAKVADKLEKSNIF